MYGEARVFAGETDFDLGMGESDGVIHKIGYDMLDGGTVRIDDAEIRRVRPPRYGLVRFGGDRVVAGDDAAHYFGYLDGLRLE